MIAIETNVSRALLPSCFRNCLAYPSFITKVIWQSHYSHVKKKPRMIFDFIILFWIIILHENTDKATCCWSFPLAATLTVCSPQVKSWGYTVNCFICQMPTFWKGKTGAKVEWCTRRVHGYSAGLNITQKGGGVFFVFVFFALAARHN